MLNINDLSLRVKKLGPMLTHMPNMNGLSYRIKKLWSMLNFLKVRSKVTDKVTCSKRPSHKEHTCQI